ncbi:hypothetical protein ACFE04_030021 [Oxalis oulophora]
MNPTTDQPPQPHRLSTSCDRHPDEHFAGFCPSCLCERLSVLDPSNNNPSSSTSSNRKPPPTSSTAVAALKAIFKPSSGNVGPTLKSTFLPELRRTKSFSASKNEAYFSGVFEPQRKSCDVRVRNTLSNLFNQDHNELLACCSSSSRPSFHEPVVEECDDDNDDDDDEIDDIITSIELPNVCPVIGSGEIVEEIEDLNVVEDKVKTMKDHIDIDSQTKKAAGRDLKDIAGSFWSAAASGFSKKLQNWRLKQKLKKRNNVGSIGSSSARLPVEKPIGKQYRETQSEIADYGFGRRSCDTDPRFSLDIGRMSLDAGRISIDDPRHSFDEPRASWDGYLSRNFPRMPTMLSVVEGSPAPEHNHVARSDSQIPVEQPMMNCDNEVDESVPGGTVQTREYYSESRRRKSLDRSNSVRKSIDRSGSFRKSLDRSSSVRKMAAAVVAEMNEPKSAAIANSKVTPAGSDNVYTNFQNSKLVVPSNREFRDCSSNSLRDDCSETFEIPFREVIGNGERKGTSNKKSMWNKAMDILGFIQRRSGNKDEEEDKYSRVNGNGVERSFSESWQEYRGERNGGFNPKLSRSNSSVSWRTSVNFGGSLKKNGFETNGHGKKKRDEALPERNRSGRYSPDNIENGLLRFNLTPMRGSQISGLGKSSRSNQAQSITKSVLRMMLRILHLFKAANFLSGNLDSGGNGGGGGGGLVGVGDDSRLDEDKVRYRRRRWRLDLGYARSTYCPVSKAFRPQHSNVLLIGSDLRACPTATLVFPFQLPVGFSS